MAKVFRDFIEEMKIKLLAYEMDMSCFDDYNDEEIELIKRLRDILFNHKQEIKIAQNKNKRK